MANEQAQFEKALQQVQKDIIKLVDRTMERSMNFPGGLLVGELDKEDNFIAELIVDITTKGVDAINPNNKVYSKQEILRDLKVKIDKQGIQTTSLNSVTSYILTIQDEKNPKKLARAFYGGEKEAEDGQNIIYHPEMGTTSFEIPELLAKKLQKELAITIKNMAKKKATEIKVGNK